MSFFSPAFGGSLRGVRAGVLDVGLLDLGRPDAPAVVLMHGFPYDIHAYEAVAPRLVDAGLRVIVPYMRGYGATRFIEAHTPRSGEQAAFGADLLALLDALALPRAILAGYDWGGRACCVVAALWPERCAGLVTLGSYNIQRIASAMTPIAPQDEAKLWYQYYFHTERGERGLTQDRAALCRLLWRMWSPTWAFDDSTFQQSAAAFDNPDFVPVVIHSYRHRYGLVPGDPAYADIEARLAQQPAIGVATISFDGADDGVAAGGGTASQAHQFTGAHEHRVVPGAGHNLPQEKPEAFVAAVLDLARTSSST